MIRAENLIKKEQKDVYVVETGNSLQPKLEFISLKEACSALAGKYYRVELGAKISERTRINTKRYLLATRLEREFLRGENQERNTVTIKVVDGQIFIISITGCHSRRAIGNFIGGYVGGSSFSSQLPVKSDGYYTINLIQAEDYPYDFELIDFKPLEVSSE